MVHAPTQPPDSLPKFLSIYHFSSSYLHSWCVWFQLSRKIPLNFFLPHHIYSKTWVPYNLIQKSNYFRVQCFQGPVLKTKCFVLKGGYTSYRVCGTNTPTLKSWLQDGDPKWLRTDLSTEVSPKAGLNSTGQDANPPSQQLQWIHFLFSAHFLH